jgi:hypothetical protein
MESSRRLDDDPEVDVFPSIDFGPIEREIDLGTRRERVGR